VEQDLANIPERATSARSDAAREVLASALDSYELGEELGRGRGGIVLAGRHRELGREVTVRLLPGDDGVSERLAAQAPRLVELDHPHIACIYDVVQRPGVCALVVQRLTGGTVHDRLKAGGWGEQEACAIVVAISSALQHAHDRGIRHGNLTPANLMFSGDGVVKLTDLGVADVLHGEGATDAAVDVEAITALFPGLVGGPPSVVLAAIIDRVHAPEDGDGYAGARELGLAVARAAREQWGPLWTGTAEVLAGAEPALRVPRPSGAHETAAGERPGAATIASSEPVVPLYLAADETKIAAIEEAVARCGQDQRPLRLRLLCHLAVELHLAGRQERCAELCAQALDIAWDIGGPWAEMLVRYSRLVSAWSPQDLAGRRAECEALGAAAEELGDREMAHHAQRLTLRAALEGGDIAAADAQLAELAHSAAIARPWWAWQGTLLRAMRALHAGEAADGRGLAQEALRLGRRVDAGIAQRCFEGQAVQSTWLLGRRGELIPLARAAARATPSLALRRATLAFALTELERTTEATAEFERLMATDLDAVPRDANWLPTMVLLSLVCGAVADGRRAGLLYEELAGYDERFATCGDCTVTWGPVATALGVVAGASGHVERADAHLLDGADRAMRAGAMAHRVVARREHVKVLLRRDGPGDRDRAVWLIDDALHSARRHRLAGLDDDLHALRARARAHG